VRTELEKRKLCIEEIPLPWAEYDGDLNSFVADVSLWLFEFRDLIIRELGSKNEKSI